MIQSCIVLKEEYYFPSADGAFVQKESCRGNVGADNKLTFEWEGVNAIFSVRKLGDPLRFVVTFEVTQGSLVVWPEQQIIGKTESGHFELAIESFKKIISYGDNFETADYPVNTVMKNSSKKEMESYFQSSPLSNNSITKIEIEGISLIVNGEKIILPKMNFEKAKGVFLHPLNC